MVPGRLAEPPRRAEGVRAAGAGVRFSAWREDVEGPALDARRRGEVVVLGVVGLEIWWRVR